MSAFVEAEQRRLLNTYLSMAINILHDVKHNKSLSYEDRFKLLMQVQTTLPAVRRCYIYLMNMKEPPWKE